MILNKKKEKYFSLNIEYKIIISFILITTIPILVFFMRSTMLIDNEMSKVQSERINLVRKNIINMLEHEKEDILGDGIDYGHWLDFYNNTVTRNTEWFDNIFDVLISSHKGIDIINIIDNNGNTVYEYNVPECFSTDCEKLIDTAKYGGEFVSLVAIANKLYIISFTQINSDDDRNKIGGILILAKRLDKQVLSKFPKEYNVAYDFIYGELKEKELIYDKDVYNVEVINLYDYRGIVVAKLVIKEIHDVVRVATDKIRNGLMVAAIIAFTLVLLFFKMLKNNIMQPIKNLRQKVRIMRNNCDSEKDIAGDEIAALTEEFEAMSADIKKHAMEIEYKNQALEYLVYNDDIIGAYNNRYFEKQLNEEFENTKKMHESLSLLLIDIDYFRYYRKLVGRNKRNTTLKEIYCIVKSEVEEQSKVCFDGNDEFRIIMSGIDYKKALVIADEIISKVSKQKFYGMDRLPRGQISISCGLASYPEDALDYDKLFDIAQDRLTRTKYHNQGKIGYYYSIFTDLKDDIQEDKKTLVYMSKAFLAVIDAMDEYTYTHTEGVVKYSMIIADELKLSEGEKLNLKMGALLHDIGKLELGREILNKKEKLTDEEIQFIKQHPQFGVNMLKALEGFTEIVDMVKYHHERYDGQGYPEKIAGETIPLAARIIAVADSFDAMTTTRVYRKSHKTYEEAMEELLKCAGTQFDPAIVKAFKNYIDKNGYNFLLVE